MLTDVAVTPSQYYLLHGKTADGRMQLLEDGMVGGAGHYDYPGYGSAT